MRESKRKEENKGERLSNSLHMHALVFARPGNVKKGFPTNKPPSPSTCGGRGEEAGPRKLNKHAPKQPRGHREQ